jgi:hypothetical protein
VNRKGLICAGFVAGLCAAAVLTLLTWPPTDPITWQPLSPPAWWQFEWLVALGFILSALPSLVIFKLDVCFAAHEHLRNPPAAFLLFTEVAMLCIGTHALVAALDRPKHPRHGPND